MREQCLDLLAESARASANKLKFFRLAFGAAGGFADEVDTREAQAAIEGLFGADAGSSSAGWSRATMTKGALKVLLNLALIAGDALVRGGRLDVGAESTSDGHRHRRPRRGPRIVLDPELRETLATGASNGRGRAARRRGLACPRLAAGSRRHDPAIDRPSEVLMIGATLPRQG